MIEQSNKTTLQVYISREAKKNIRIFAATHNITMSEVIETFFTQQLDALPAPEESPQVPQAAEVEA